ncbi:MAG: M1 family metallopeptidase [Lewinellaceae bacterium]|nr:M1 family metallopeptidase [Saprospiraceae bacterium]MCB9340476.1 M1 family metallopeptidase [Lewinellaceae bacterium]
MKQTIRLFFPCICLALLPVLSWGQCDPYFNPPLSPRTASYDISLALDTGAKIIKASETLTWINASPDTLREMRFYMYLNAFKNSESTFLKGATEIFGQDFTRRNAGEWGWINVDSIGRQGGRELTPGIRYIQPDDGNPQDQSVLQVPLDRPLPPGDTLVLHLKFTAKMPKIIARAGYSKDDYFMFTHWFPQAGVYQVNLDGQWGWNCHQFHRMTEFFADFGSYDVKITAAKRLVTGASGCLVGEQENGDGTVTRHYHADDVIDFAWVAYPYFEIYEEKWEHVNIRLLIPPEHCMMAERYIGVIKHSLSYLTEHVGRYPYPTITIVDPPMHALRSGLMEYPTLITAGSFYNTPICFHNSEALAAHEFAHQYFMAMVASNEKEEAWLDEGFVTWFEDRIVDDAFGQKRSLVDLFGYRYDSQELSRLEYTGMKNPKAGIIARPSWEFAEARKELIYSKTATSLETLRNLAGEEVMDKIIKAYFERWKFRHPKGTDFLAVLEEVGKRELGEAEGGRILAIFKECLYTTDICDYLVSDIVINKISTPTGLFDAANGGHVFEKGKTTDQYHSEVVLYRKGDMIFAQEVEIVFDNGEKITEQWDGTDRRKVFEYEGYRRVVSAHIDPQQKILLDLDLNNNSLTLEPKTSPLLRYATRAVYWIQNILQTLSFIC